MKLLVTGAAGFIGECVVLESLKRGHQTIALVRSTAPSKWSSDANLQNLQCDLRHPEKLDLTNRGIDVIVHLAAATAGGAAQQHSDTVVGTLNLLNAARQAGIHRLVGISSIAVLDYLSAHPMSAIDERNAVWSRREPMGTYASAKLRQESLFVSFGSHPGESCVILRPGLVYDETRLIRAHAGIIKGPIGVLVAHDGEVPTIEVQGLARAIVDAAETPVRGCEIVHLVDDCLPSQSLYLAGLRRRGLLPRVAIVVPWWMLRRLSNAVYRALLVAGLDPKKIPDAWLPNSFSARMKPFRFSNAKAKEWLHWTPSCGFR